MPVTTSKFALRPFEGSGEMTPGERPSLMILDGQQRLTSLYQALYRPEGVQVKGRTYQFYLDVPILLKHQGADDSGNAQFADALFFIKEEKSGKRVRYAGLEPRYRLTTRDDELTVGCLPLSCIFDANGSLAKWREQYLLRLSAGELTRFVKLSAEWNTLVQPWLDRICGYPFPEVQLRADMPLAAICHIFEKVNSTGVRLDVFDLCTAILWAKGFYLNEEWARTRQEIDRQNLLLMQPKPLSGTHFLQAIALLDSMDRKRANPKERLAVSCRKEELMELSVETVRKWWSVILDSYAEASKFLANEGILNVRILPYTTLLVPLSAMLADVKLRKGAAHLGAASPKIAQWYWCSVFSQRYSSQLDSAAAQDFEQVMAWIDGGEPPDVVRTFGFRSDTLQEITSIRNAIYKGVLCLLARDGAMDFGGGGKLSTELYYNTRQDHHHIFPTDALKQLGIKDPRADTIVNKTLISSAVNQSIAGRLPSKYVAGWRQKLGANRLGGNLFDDVLTTHVIDPERLGADDWEGFVLNRRERLRQLIESACGGNVQPFFESDARAIETISEDEDEEAS